VNNLSYHGRDMTVVWNDPAAPHYANVPTGYSLYVDGKRVLTVDRLAHVSWDAAAGDAAVLDDSGANVTFSAGGTLAGATDISLYPDARSVDLFQKAGRDLTLQTGWLTNIAEGKPVAASFTTTTPALRATSPAFAVDGWTISGLPASGPAGQARPGYLSPNTIWGACSTALPACGNGSPNAQEWLEVDLGQSRPLDTVKLYFFSDKSYNPQQNASRDTYRPPSAYSIQYFDGTNWIDVPNQTKTPTVPQANYNVVTFPQVEARRVRVLMTRSGNFGIGVKELQVFDAVNCTRTIRGFFGGRLDVLAGVTCLADGSRVVGQVRVRRGAGLVATGATVTGPLTAEGASVVELFDTDVTGPVRITGSTRRVAIAGSEIDGPVTVADNNTGSVPIVISDDTVVGPLSCSGNQPPPSNGGQPNHVTGPRSGQCATL
jgi:hypothetical protein